MRLDDRGPLGRNMTRTSTVVSKTLGFGADTCVQLSENVFRLSVPVANIAWTENKPAAADFNGIAVLAVEPSADSGFLSSFN
jgi:hypothetical protein